jgi:hypothetical protein
MSVNEIGVGKLTVIKSRMWGQYRHPKDNVLVKLPAYPEAQEKYVRKGFIFIRHCDDDTPVAIVDMRPEVLDKIVSVTVAPVADINPPSATPEPEVYVAEHPYKSKRKPKRKYTRRVKE